MWRLLIVCSSPPPFSAASRITNPWLPLTYIARTPAVTSQASGPSNEGASAMGPDPAGWLAHVTPASVQLALAGRASSVRPSLPELASTRRVADATVVQPAPSVGSGKRMKMRESEPDCDLSFSVESLPKLLDGLLWFTQLSRSAASFSLTSVQEPGCGSASGSSNTRTRSGGCSAPFSWLWNDCAPAPFSARSLIRKPWLPCSYMSRVCSRTSHERKSSPDSVPTPRPAVPGWFAQVTFESSQSDVIRSASRVRPLVAAEEYRRRLASIRRQPDGIAGSAKWTSARSFALFCEPTFRIESPPKLELAALCDIQLS